MYGVEISESLFPAQTDGAPADTTTGGVLAAAAAAYPDRPALSELLPEGGVGRTWTYGKLHDEARSLATALSTRFAAGESVAVWAPSIPEWVILQFAAALAGLRLVTLNPAYKVRELVFALEQSGAVGLFLVEEYRGNRMAEIAAEAAGSIAALREVTLLTDRDALLRHEGEPGPLPQVAPDDPALLLYTSGTTGQPKGAVLHHGGITSNGRLFFRRLQVDEGIRFLTAMPMFHVGGCVVAVLSTVQAGGHLILASIFDSNVMLDAIDSERPEVMTAVPTMLVDMLDKLAGRARDVSSVQRIVSGGAVVPPELVRQVRATFGCDFQNIYGQTECSGVLSQTYVDDDVEDTCESVGQALPAIELSVRSTADNTVCPLDTVGEICARGRGLMLEYNANPEATAATVDGDGWLHTGDLGRMDSRGYVRVTGRVKEMIIRGGENLFPVEIENILLEYPDVAEVAVVGIPDDRWGEVVACFIRTRSGDPIPLDELRAHCRAHLSPQKTPAYWKFVTDWPMTPSGKIQKFALRDTYADTLRQESA
ncbi:MAG: class I adenylate-forming enzyme family protein [Minwuia sp.]|nr:class I adenylate-forming enzyme family protein [Minwuia sp.]